LLDECTSALDPAHQHGVMEIVRDFAAQGTATLAVMHDIALAAAWADKVLILKQGEVIAQGDATVLQQAQILQQAYELPVELARRYAQQTAIWSAGG
jgi:iron complex transport system ATP-binding protein